MSIDNNQWSLNEECQCCCYSHLLHHSTGPVDYLLAHSSRIVIPRDSGGQFATRIGVTVNGTFNWALDVQAYATPRLSSSDPPKYGIVVINWYDNAATTWDPIPVNATIAFRGQQVCEDCLQAALG